MRNAIRTSNINIDSVVPDGTRWVNAEIQRLEIDDNDNVISISPKNLQLHRKIDKVATETVVCHDPVLGENITISVAGLGTAITSLMVKWMLEDNSNAIYDKSSGRVIINDSD